MKWKGFTLVELLVTLAIFSVAMLAISGVLMLTLRTFERYSESSGFRLPVMVFTRVMDYMSINSYNVVMVTNGNIRLESFDGKSYELSAATNGIAVASIEKERVFQNRLFRIPESRKIEFSILSSGKRKGFEVHIIAKGLDWRRPFILGYRKSEAEQ